MFKTALKFLWFDKAKSFGALSGVILSVFLVGQQAGIFIFLTNAMCSVARNNPNYIWVVDEKTENVSALGPLDVRLQREIESIQGVKSVSPLVLAGASAKFSNGTTAGVTLVGVQQPGYAGGPWNIYKGKKELLQQEGAVFTDFFDVKALGGVKPGEYFEINGRKVFNAGQTKGVRSFGGGVYVFCPIERARAIGKFGNNKVSALLIKWDDAVGKEEVVRRINTHIRGVRAWSSEDLAKATVITVLKTSGIAISFGTLIFFALIVGFVIIGLTLYSAAIDRIKDYGTLKAIGANNGYITRLILMQALLVAVVGFIIGTGLVEAFRNGIANAGTIFDFPLWLRGVFFGVTMLIAIFGSIFAIRRITSLEPAAVFR